MTPGLLGACRRAQAGKTCRRDEESSKLHRQPSAETRPQGKIIRTMTNPGRSNTLRASPRMFESNLLDRLSRVHPSVPGLIFGPLIVGMTVWALQSVSLLGVIGLVIAGYALWT